MTRNAKGVKREPHMEMYEAILTLKTPDECVKFFYYFCSVTELRAIEQRFQVARMLREGNIYSTILEKTGASSATISRVNRSLYYGMDGYEIVFSRLDEKKHSG
jgi:TrpR-related protein YerC/YecD